MGPWAFVTLGQLDYWDRFVPTDGTRLPIDRNGDFGESPLLGQLSGKQLLDRSQILHGPGPAAMCFVPAAAV